MGVKKRLDDRIRILLEHNIRRRHRSMMVIVGDHGRDQVVNLHRILVRTALVSTTSEDIVDTSSPSQQQQLSKRVLWCYKKELGFSSHKKKRMKKLKRDQQRGLVDQDDLKDAFELFVSNTDVSWCYYKDATHRALGQTFGMLVLQDFEALTPNLLAQTIETVQGGGLVVFLLRTVASLQQLYTMSMDVHQRYRTESGGDVIPRFNERFLLSWANCSSCLVCDDELNILPLSRQTLRNIGTRQQHQQVSETKSANDNNNNHRDLTLLKESLMDAPHVGALVELAMTVDQAKALLVVMDACSDTRTATSTLSSPTSAGPSNSTVAVTAARGRGKSAALGLALAGCASLGYSIIAVTAPDPDNVQSVFEFCTRGLNALSYKPHVDYTVTYRNHAKMGTGSGSGGGSREATAKSIVSIEIHRSHRQLIRYVPPNCPEQFATSEIVAIDEAAAIPLPIVKALIKPNQITILSSTVNGYEGTGRALSLKLVHELRSARGVRQSRIEAAQHAAASVAGVASHKGQHKVHEQRWSAAAEAASGDPLSSSSLREVELITPIRYASGDHVEAWLNKLLCLDCGSSLSASTSPLKLSGGAPAPAECELYSVDRDALFSYHKLSEAFLQKIMALYTSAHYKNTPNDLQMLSDAPAHALFCLLSPRAERDSDRLPDVMAVIQVALEGGISRKAVEAQLARGHRSAGDLIPWTIAQQFGDAAFAKLSGARVVRIAVHPHVQGMGYGSRAMDLLYRYYNGEMVSLTTNDEVDDEHDTVDSDSESGGESSDDDEGSHNDDEKESSVPGSGGLRGETLKPRKELPPLLLPLTEVEPPRLDWIGTSFGLTLQLHNFWCRRGMRMLYVRQTKNELTGEHSAIMLRALPNRAGFDESWLRLYLLDVRKRFISLLSGAFRDMDVRLAVSVLENMAEEDSNTQDASNLGARPTTTALSADELDYFMSPHDLKRLEQYGRNLCDHHLVTDLLPTVCRLYFSRRFGPELNVSSVQAALLTGIGLQNRTVDQLTAELGLPSNQVLAMFNKAVRKISIALNGIVESREKKSLTTNEKRKNVEAAVERMRDVTRRTFEEEAEEVAREADAFLNPPEARALAPEILNDPDLGQYVVKGTDEQWKVALGGGNARGNVRIESVREKRRHLTDDDIVRENTAVDPKRPKLDKKKSKKGRMSR